MEKVHSLLKRQIKRHFGNINAIPRQWEELMNAVSDAYRQMDLDRAMLERSLDLSSQELLQANSEMRAVLRAFPDILLRTDREGTILDYQTSNVKDLHFLQGQVIGRQIINVFPGDIGIKFDEGIGRVQRTRSLVSMEFSVTGQEREYFYEARLLPLVESQIIIIIRNISERKYAEEALRASEERYRSLFDGVPVGLYRSTPAAQLLDANLAYVHMLDYPDRETLMAVNITDLYVYPEIRAQWQALIKREGVVHDFDIQLRRRDGATIWVRNNGRAVLDDQGQVLCYEGILEDITERKHAEEALRESENRYRAIFENTGTAMVILEEDTTISLANTEFSNLTGYTRQEIEGKKNWTEFVVKEDLDKMVTQHRLRRVAADAAQKNYDFRLLEKDGRIKDIFLTIDMIPGTKKSVASLLNITERKRAEAALRGGTISPLGYRKHE